MPPMFTSRHLPADPILFRALEHQRELRLAARARPTSQGERSALRWPAVLAILLGLTLSMSGLSVGRASAMSEDAWIDAHGVYELDSGEQFTLYGHHPMLELGGEEVHLVSDGPDMYVADGEPFELISLRRGAHGDVVSVSLTRPGRDPQLGRRIEPFSEREVTFDDGDVALSGSLLTPSGAGPHPAVAIVHGAEFGTRETYRLMASHLARRGVAALIYDKRGTGVSGGTFSTATFDDLTSDALAAVALLRDQPRIDPDRIGLIGMSQGGWIIAQAATQSHDVAFLVALSASGFTPAEQAAWLTGSMLAVRGFDQGAIDASARAWAMMYSSLDLVEAGIIARMPHLPGFWFHALDPHLAATELWEQVRQPVLALWGELDCQVPAHDSLAAIRAALERGQNTSYDLRILPRADHGFGEVGPCEREIGSSHGGRYHYADGFLSAPAEWILSLENGRKDRSVVVAPERTPSPLGWHQPSDTAAPWFGSMAAQLAVLPVLLVFFGSVSLAGPARRAVAVVRRRPSGGRPSRVWWNLAGPAAFVATVVGALALVELLMLADLRSAPLVGGPSVSGTSPVFAAAGVLTAIALGFGAVAFVTDVRTGQVRRVRAGLTVIGLLVLGAWTIYWGFIPLPRVG